MNNVIAVKGKYSLAYRNIKNAAQPLTTHSIEIQCEDPKNVYTTIAEFRNGDLVSNSNCMLESINNIQDIQDITQLAGIGFEILKTKCVEVTFEPIEQIDCNEII